MGGMLFPTAKGILDGRIKGLNSPQHITLHLIKNGLKEFDVPSPYRKPGIEYYIGVGTGYEQGQKIRQVLENDTRCKMPLEEKIRCFSFLLEKQESCRKVNQQAFLDHIQEWNNDHLPLPIVNMVKELLAENKIQRSVDTLFHYFQKHFQLKALVEFYEVYNALIKVRRKKKEDKTYSISEELENIKAEVQKWVELKR